jgi:serine/threonine protein kinase
VKLGDFGLACKISEGVKNVSFVGTAGYQAPEIIDRKGILSNYIAYGREVDFWSLGVLLYELIFKDLPFDAY